MSPRTNPLDDAADRLYGLPRDDFIPARRDLAREAKDGGDPETARKIEKLGKPTTAAWLANRLARDEPDRLRDLVELGAELRAAHGSVSGAELRALTRRRNDAVRELIAAAGEITDSVERELEEILTAAVTDEGAAGQVLAGRLTSAKSLVVTPGWPMSGELPAPAPRKAADRGPRRSQEERRREKAGRELEQARRAVKQAEAERAEREREFAAAESVVDEAVAEVRRIERELTEAEDAEQEARRRRDEARRAVKAAERAAGQAWRQVQQAESKASGEG